MLCQAYKATTKFLDPMWTKTRRGSWGALRRFGQVYVAGARPTILWCMVPCSLYVFILGPLLQRPADAFNFCSFCALCLGAVVMRSQDKKHGVASGESPAGIGMGPGAAEGCA